MPPRSALIAAAVAAAALSGPAGPARADMMSACAPAIGQFCADVRRGRGRLAACLASQRPALAQDCRAEVLAAGRSPLVPRTARAVLAPGFSAALPPACAEAAARFCPGLPSRDGRVLACLYARSDRVDAPCVSAARSAITR
jgi:hypothetical protein